MVDKEIEMTDVLTLAKKLCSDLKADYYKNGCNLECEYDLIEGRKYLKLVHVGANQRSAHAFIDKKTGDVYMAASWAAPAKGVRCNLFTSYPAVVSWSGGWLYLR